jgi:hypothetical protein
MKEVKKWNTICATGKGRQENIRFGSPSVLSQEEYRSIRTDSPFLSLCALGKGYRSITSEEVTILSLKRTFFLFFRGCIRGFHNLLRDNYFLVVIPHPTQP